MFDSDRQDNTINYIAVTILIIMGLFASTYEYNNDVCRQERETVSESVSASVSSSCPASDGAKP